MQFAEREWGEFLALDESKDQQEFAALSLLHETPPGSVPRPYFLDATHRASKGFYLSVCNSLIIIIIAKHCTEL